MSRPLLAAEVDGRDDVGDVGAARDQARPLVDHAVVERARLVVAGVSRLDDVAAESLRKGVDGLVSSMSRLPGVQIQLQPAWLAGADMLGGSRASAI